MKNNNLKKSICIAAGGFWHGIATEGKLRIHIIIAIIVITASVLLDMPRTGLAIIIFICFFVIILEMINTAFELLIDRICKVHDRDFGMIKDIMAGAVLLAVILSIIIALIIILPRLAAALL